MKKVVVFFLLTIVFAGTTTAQEAEALWRFGISAKPSISWLGTNLQEFENDGARLNFGYGLMVERSIFSSTVIAGGIFVNDFRGTFNYVEKDQHVKFHEQNDSIRFETRKMSLKYVEVPFKLKFRTPEINYITYTAHFGINMGFRVKAMADDHFRDIRADGTTGVYDNRDIRDDIGFIKMALDVGIGGEYNLAGTTSLLVGLSYLNGFSNITRKESEMLRYLGGDNAKMKQVFYGHTIMLSVGVLF